MSHHQNRSVARERQQPINKKKSQQSVGASSWVKQKLYWHIQNKLNQAASGRTVSENLDHFAEESPLRRTVSESVLAVRSRQSWTSRRNLTLRKTSAPPAVREHHSNVFQGMLSYSTLQAHEAGRPNSTWSGSAPFSLHSQICSVHQNVPTGWAYRSLGKTKLESSYFPDQMQKQHKPRETFTLGNICSQQEPQQWSERLNTLEAKEDHHSTHHRLIQTQSMSDYNTSGSEQSHHQRCVYLNQDLYIKKQLNYTTGLVYDPPKESVLRQECECGDLSTHPETSRRVRSICWRLSACGLWSQCKLMGGRRATDEELQSVHSPEHVFKFSNLSDEEFLFCAESACSLQCEDKNRDENTLDNSSITESLQMAVGGVIDLAMSVAKGEMKNGFAVVRPPGHHASRSENSGFSFFNSVAIAAKQLQERLKLKKILIVDWDIHHGSGTENIFKTDPSVLYISLHRYDDGGFFPGSGGHNMVGYNRGEGYNVNVAWSGGLNPPMGDAEYLAAFRTVVLPIAREFSPDVVLVSAGFDAAAGHSAALGGYTVSANCFGHMTWKLKELAEGRVVMVLEGGYHLTSLCDASQACVSALMGSEPEPLSEDVLLRKPCANAVDSLKKILDVQRWYWPSVRPMLDTVSLSLAEADIYSCQNLAASSVNPLMLNVRKEGRYDN